MRILLDTHAFLWFCGGDQRLTQKARETIENSSNQSLISIASLWEMTIKISLGKLKITQSIDNFFQDQIENNGFDLMPIEFLHLNILVNLPFNHRDPFDRLLIAQAISEKIPIISSDKAFDTYPVNRLWL